MLSKPIIEDNIRYEGILMKELSSEYQIQNDISPKIQRNLQENAKKAYEQKSIKSQKLNIYATPYIPKPKIKDILKTQLKLNSDNNINNKNEFIPQKVIKEEEINLDNLKNENENKNKDNKNINFLSNKNEKKKLKKKS